MGKIRLSLINSLLLAFSSVALADNSNSLEDFTNRLQQNTAAAKKYYTQIYQNKYQQVMQDPSLQAVIPTPQQSLAIPSLAQQANNFPQQANLNNSIFNSNASNNTQPNIFQ